MAETDENEDFSAATFHKKDESNTYRIFGRDIAEIPCFRDSYLRGISGGIVGGLLTFLFTSKPRLSMHCGMATYVGITISYWFYCRHSRATERFNALRIQDIIQNATVLEGTPEGPVFETDKTLVDV